MNKFKVHTFQVGMLQTNCYILVAEDLRSIVIDPGGDCAMLLDFITSRKLIVESIINTHGHFDHILCNKAIKKATNAKIYLHKYDFALIQPQNVIFNLDSVAPDVSFEDGAVIHSCGLKVKVIHTPGHTPGGVCLLLDDILFSGDTLFKECIGRCDLPGGDEMEMENSLKKFLNMDKKLKVLPGHGEPTVLEHEIKYNPYLNN